MIGALSVFQLDCLSTIRASYFFVLRECIQVIVGYEPGLLFVRILNPVPRMSWLACVWKTVIRLPMFPVRLLLYSVQQVGHVVERNKHRSYIVEIKNCALNKNVC